MPIVVPGRRFGSEISRSKARSQKFVKSKKSVFVALNLTSMIDMFVILVIFLIQNFSATGEILFMQKDIRLPEATKVTDLERGPVIAITHETITLEGIKVGESKYLREEGMWTIPELEQGLTRLREQQEKLRPRAEGEPFTGKVIIQADQKTDFLLIKKVVNTCNLVGYFNINFAVLPAGSLAAATPPAI